MLAARRVGKVQRGGGGGGRCGRGGEGETGVLMIGGRYLKLTLQPGKRGDLGW